MEKVYISLLGVVFLNLLFRTCINAKHGRKVNKVIGFFFNLIFIVTVVLIMAHSNYSDIKIYRNWYNTMGRNPKFALQRFEIGYGIVMLLCTRLNIDFYCFKIIVFSLCFAMLWYVNKKYSGDFTFFISSFLIYELFFDGIQIRNFIAICIVLVGLSVVMNQKEPNFKTLVKYLFCVLIASTIHSSSIVYVAFAVIMVEPFRKIFKSNFVKVVYITIIGVLTLIARHGLVNFILKIVSGSGDVADRIGTHSAGSSRLSPIYLSITMLLYFIISCVMCYKIKQQNLERTTSTICTYNSELVLEKEIEIVEMINYIGLLFIPLVFLSTTYYRLIRTVSMIDIMFFSAMWGKSSAVSKKLLIQGVNIMLLFMWIYYDLIMPGRFITHINGYLE